MEDDKKVEAMMNAHPFLPEWQPIWRGEKKKEVRVVEEQQLSILSSNMYLNFWT